MNSAKSAIKALSSGRFLTPGSPVRTVSLDDRNRPEETSGGFFADGLAFPRGTDDVGVSGPEITGEEESLRPTLEIRPFSDQEELPDASSGFSRVGGDETVRSTFGALRALHGGDIPTLSSSQFHSHQIPGAEYPRPEFRSPFVPAPASVPVSRLRSPQTPPHAGGAGMGPGHFSGTSFSQDLLLLILGPRP